MVKGLPSTPKITCSCGPLVTPKLSRLGYSLLIIGDGPEYTHLSDIAPKNVKLLGRLSDQEVADLLGKARAFVHAAEEDFCIALE